MFATVAFAARMVQPDLAKDPAASTALLVLTKIGNVVKQFDFYQSKCAVTTFAGNAEHTRSVTHYREAPQPKSRGVTPEKDNADTKPEVEKTPESAAQKP